MSLGGDAVQAEVAPGLRARGFINFKWGVGNDIVLFNSCHVPHEKNVCSSGHLYKFHS